MDLFKRIRGFTLIETIIYSVLIAVIIGYSIGGVYSLIQDSQRLNARAIIDEEANFLLKKIDWALSSVDLVLLPVAGTIGSSLSLNRFSFPLNPIVFDLNSGNLRMSYSLSQPVILNNDRVVVTNLSFQHIAPVGLKPAAIKTTMTVNGRVYTMTMYQNR